MINMVDGILIPICEWISTTHISYGVGLQICRPVSIDLLIRIDVDRRDEHHQTEFVNALLDIYDLCSRAFFLAPATRMLLATLRNPPAGR
jgi:hypothetical protein